MRDERSAPPLDESFFRPRSMAFIGASPDLTKIRGRLFAYAHRNGYAGELFPITPSHAEVGGYKTHAAIGDLGRPVDLAVIAIPARAVPAAVEDCAAAGVRNALVIASGFAEEGGAASGLQDRLAEIARRTGIRIAGPNSEGFFNAAAGIAATFSPVVETLEDVTEAAPERRIGVISQSGGMGFAIFTRGRAMGLSFSTVVSSGNEVDLTAADFLDWMVRDPATAVIVMICETVRDGPGFLSGAAAARAAGKPVVMVKLGRSPAGARAAASHTASLTGAHEAYRAVFARHGILEAAETDEALAMAAALAVNPLPRGRRVGVVTASGGGGTTMSDVYSAHGLVLPELSPALQAQLRPMIPPHASALNPVDTTAQGHRTGPVSMACVEALEASGEVDMITVIVSAARETSVALLPEALKRVTAKARVPLLVWTYTLASRLGRRLAAEGGTVMLTDMTHCARGLAGLVRLAEHLPPEPVPDGPALPPPGTLAEYRAKRWLADYGVGGAADVLAADADAAVAAAEAIGGPVALKIQSPDILHKTELGGVWLGMEGADAVRAAHAELVASVAAKAPEARIDGVLVQKMAPKGIELVAGMVNDPTFGPIMLVGIGGTAVELYGDVVHYPAPFGPATAARLLGSLKGAALWNGFRGAPKVDVGPAAALISRLSQAAWAARAHVAEMEFNPIILHGDGSGVTVADALVIAREA